MTRRKFFASILLAPAAVFLTRKAWCQGDSCERRCELWAPEGEPIARSTSGYCVADQEPFASAKVYVGSQAYIGQGVKYTELSPSARTAESREKR